MKKLLFVLGITSLLASCTKDETFDVNVQSGEISTRALQDNVEAVMVDKIVLGAKLDNPYSVKNMQLASDKLIKDNLIAISPNRIPKVITTHYYVKFKPQTAEDLISLKQDSTLILYEYPLDYEVIEDGISYHDPEIPDSLPTYQYASIAANEWRRKRANIAVQYEVLENLFIPDEDNILVAAGEEYVENCSVDIEDKDWDIIETLVDESMKITDNIEPIGPQTRGSSKWRPSGRITAYDNITNGAIPLTRARVRARRWFTTHIGYTDQQGYFSCNGRFSRPANYSIVWESGRWDIRDGNIVQAYYNGPKKKGNWNLYISGGKSVRYATIHRAAFRFYYGYTNGLSRPNNSRKEKIAYLHKKGNGINGDYNQQWGAGIWSDIRIYGKNDSGWRELSDLFSTVCHELGHAAHYTNNRNTYGKSKRKVLESWARCVQYILTTQEYKDLGVISKLPTYPDSQFNFNSWNKVSSDPDYTPIFIDLIDNLNQRQYYGNSKNYPDDVIHDMPVADVQRIAFKSKTFTDVKKELLSYAAQNQNSEKMYNLSSATITRLFETYEN